MAQKKLAPPKLVYCPFCRDGGNPRYLRGETEGHGVECQGCGVWIIRPLEEDVVLVWNTRFFLTEPAKMAAYSALVNLATLRVQWTEMVAKTISKKKIEAARDAFLRGCALFIDGHGGIIRSALNDMESENPPKKERKNGKKPTKH